MWQARVAVASSKTLNLQAAEVYALMGLATLEALRAGGAGGGASPYALACEQGVLHGAAVVTA